MATRKGAPSNAEGDGDPFRTYIVKALEHLVSWTEGQDRRHEEQDRRREEEDRRREEEHRLNQERWMKLAQLLGGIHQEIVEGREEARIRDQERWESELEQRKALAEILGELLRRTRGPAPGGDGAGT